MIEPMDPIDDADASGVEDLSDAHCLVLAAIDLSGGVEDVPALAEELGLSPSEVREILLQLEAAGLVERHTVQ